MKNSIALLSLLILQAGASNLYAQRAKAYNAAQQNSSSTTHAISGHFEIDKHLPPGNDNTANITAEYAPGNKRIELKLSAAAPQFFAIKIIDSKNAFVTWTPKSEAKSYNEAIDISSLKGGDNYQLAVYSSKCSSPVFYSTIK